MFRHAPLLAALALTGSAAAQVCFTPDNLNGPCWDPALADLPNFPGFTMQGTAINWRDCDPEPQVCVGVSVGAPQRIACGDYRAPIEFKDCNGNSLLGGNLVMDYTRTWMEAAPNTNYQVWRFVLKIDMQRTGALHPEEIVPPSFTAWPTAFYYGYLDYAFDCDQQVFRNALVLFHNCDAFINEPGLSSTPGVFHPGRSYALVAPNTVANPFVASSLVAPSGLVIGEAVRDVPGAQQFCLTEERLDDGLIQVRGLGCGCPLGPQPNQVTARHMRGAGTCVGATGVPSRFFSLDTFPVLPWIDVMSTSIGSWTTNNTYPGQERVWADEGPFLYQDSCATAGGTPGLFAEVYYGASTRDGFVVFATPGGPPPVRNFTDLASNYSVALPGPITLPLFGAVRPTRHLIYLNVPD